MDKAFTGREMRLILDRFCTVWMAGIAAETLIYGNAEGGEEDRQKIRQALKVAGFPESGYQQKESWAKLQATNLLKENQSSYEALVKAMKARASVEDCCSILEKG
ncbi:MAG: hypothetical protein F6K10_30840 [Moorea sp. SIO2B7]|nr:hypothetical protein [Moorena sp. SIO2B7]